jgi:hypothetical protein
MQNGDIVQYELEDGGSYPAIIIEDSDANTGGTVGLIVFSRHPYYVNGYKLPVVGPVESPLENPAAENNVTPVEQSAPLVDAVPNDADAGGSVTS